MGYCYSNGNMYGRGDYYRGDYYRGDYYRGDPFSLGGLLKGAAKVARGFITGGPVGAVAAAASSIIKVKPQPPLLATPNPMVGTALAPMSPPRGIGMGYFGPSGGGFGMGIFPEGGGGGGGGGMGPGPGIPTLRGYHYNKSTYETRGGGTSRWGPAGSLAIHPKGSTLVKNRRVNVGNARALRHALRRAYGFERLARRVLHLTSPKKHFSGFKRRVRRRK
jgi:hypothetical protein